MNDTLLFQILKKNGEKSSDAPVIGYRNILQTYGQQNNHLKSLK